MSELWEQVAALGETRHQLVMVLLDSALARSDIWRAREIFATVDRINRIVDEIDKTNSGAISKVHEMLASGLVQLQRGALTEHAAGSLRPTAAAIDR